MFLTFVFGAFVLLLIWDHLRRKSRADAFAKWHIKGPVSLPLLGCGLEALTLGPESLLQYFGHCFEKYGKTIQFWVLQEAQLHTMDVRLFESILSSTTMLQKGDLYRGLRCWLNDGLLLSNGRKWHSRRKVFTPAFHFKMLEHYVGVFDRQSAIMVEKFRPMADGRSETEVMSIVCLAALDVITEAAMGVKVHAQSDPEFPYVKALKHTVYVLSDRLIKINSRYDWLFRVFAPRQYRRLMQDINTMHDFTIKVIEERRADVQRAVADGSYKPLKFADDDIGSKQQMALLDLLLQSTIDGKPLTNEDIREEVDTFMFEGDDTTTSGVSHALYSISRHPRVQQQLLEEIHIVIGTNRDAPVSMHQLQELKYMDCVIKETLRMYPPVPSIGRKLDKAMEIDGLSIPADTSVYLHILWAQRNPDYFPDPDSFKPERFLETAESKHTSNAFSYTPFSAGPKNCIGQKFAMLEMKAMISKMLRHYELLPLGPEVQTMMNMILRSSTGVNIGLRPRVN